MAVVHRAGLLPWLVVGVVGCGPAVPRHLFAVEPEYAEAQCLAAAARLDTERHALRHCVVDEDCVEWMPYDCLQTTFINRASDPDPLRVLEQRVAEVCDATCGQGPTLQGSPVCRRGRCRPSRSTAALHSSRFSCWTERRLYLEPGTRYGVYPAHTPRRQSTGGIYDEGALVGVGTAGTLTVDALWYRCDGCQVEIHGEDVPDPTMELPMALDEGGVRVRAQVSPGSYLIRVRQDSSRSIPTLGSRGDMPVAWTPWNAAPLDVRIELTDSTGAPAEVAYVGIAYRTQCED